jgi:hypothetical protein
MNKYNKIINVTFSSIGKNRELRADLAASWEELSSSKNPNNVELSNNLLTYMMFRFGWSFSPKSAMNIAPNKAKSAFKDYKSMFSGNDESNPVAIHEFLIQYARNNWYSKIWVNPGLTSEEGSFVTKNGIKYFILTDPEIVENLHFLRMGKSRYVRIKEGVYMQVEKLGIAKNFLEYNGSASNSASMKSVITNASTSEQTKQYKGLQVQDTIEDLDSEIEDDSEEVFTEKKITTSIIDMLNSFSADIPEYIQDAEFKKLLNSRKILKNIGEIGFKATFNQAVEANDKKTVWDMLQKIATSMKDSFTEKEIEKSYKNIQKKFEEDNLC